MAARDASWLIAIETRIAALRAALQIINSVTQFRSLGGVMLGTVPSAPRRPNSLPPESGRSVASAHSSSPSGPMLVRTR
jgi:hypothetical protein